MQRVDVRNACVHLPMQTLLPAVLQLLQDTLLSSYWTSKSKLFRERFM